MRPISILLGFCLLVSSFELVLNVAAFDGEDPTVPLWKSFSVADPEVPKHLMAIRRRPGLTRKEYLKYHVLKHGEISWNTPAKPQKYIQDHAFDSVFGTAAGKAEPSYFGRDDITELVSNSLEQFNSFTFNKYTATVIGPDGAKFNDRESAFSMIAYETPITTVKLSDSHSQKCEGAKRPESYYSSPGTVTAFYWLKAKASDPSKVDNATFGQGVASALLSALEEAGPGAVYAASVHRPWPGIDSRKFYGGAMNPVMNAVVKLWLCDAHESVDGVRAAQKVIESDSHLEVDFESSFTIFAREVTLWDLNQGIQFDPERLSHVVDQETMMY